MAVNKKGVRYYKINTVQITFFTRELDIFNIRVTIFS